MEMSNNTGKVMNYLLIFSITPIVALIVYISLLMFGINIGVIYILYMLLLILFIKLILAGVLAGVSKLTGYPLLMER